MRTDVQTCQNLVEIEWPDDAVFVVDEALDRRLLTGLPERVIFVDGGEGLKSLESIGGLAAEVLHHRSTRPLTLVAIGGGTVGDAVGFLASVLWRGVDLWHVPTTLVAMVDSAHGGKTAVNLKGHKNQLGTFYPAKCVITCRDFLDSLPLDLREEGLVELLKALWLGAPEALSLFDDDESYGRILSAPVSANQDLWEKILSEAIAVKADVVESDPREESGLRRVLNLGHTAGHGLEAIYGLPHGRAVAWGLAACALLSMELAELSPAQGRRLLGHLDPLLTPLPESFTDDERRAFIACLKGDKKQRRGRLISVLLDAPGSAVQTEEISPERWWEATRRAFELWRNRPLRLCGDSRVYGASPQGISPRLPVGKSRANRALIISHLRRGPTEVIMPSGPLPTDVDELQRALEILGDPDLGDASVLAGNGGTTGRFLLVMAATRPATTRLIFAPGLARRPHGPLVAALRTAGASITELESGYEVRGWDEFPSRFDIDGALSSQFASALALLAAEGRAFRLGIGQNMVSRSYFDLTLSMLVEAGVDIDDAHGEEILFSPSPRLDEPMELVVPADSSAVVIWQALATLGRDFSPPHIPDVDHPDAAFSEITERLSRAGIDDEITVDLSDAPDLAPVLAALAASLPPALLVKGAAHLRVKESDRIVDLAESFAEVGLRIEARDDGFFVPAGVQKAQRGAIFDPRGDHRLAMAALVLANFTPLEIIDARCAAKSYPDLWRQARRLGFRVEPNVESTESSERSDEN